MKDEINLLFVPYLPVARYNDGDETLKGLFSAIEPNRLFYEPWPGKGVKPDVEFKMAYGDDAFFLKYTVSEKHFRAVYKQTNDPVWNDSCVEFFIGFEENGAYYNFEFNALGTPLVGYGINKQRELLDPALINGIKRIAEVKKNKDGAMPFYWELTLVIPFSVFYKHRFTTSRGAECRANFYKCGDMLPEPHFLCWNNIEAGMPDFHLPQYFGKLMFY